MRRWLVLLALLPNCTGCLYYAYPTVTHTPEVAVENRDGNAHAFRVDIDHTERHPAPVTAQYTLMRIPIDARGLIPSQLELATTTGVLNPLGVVDAGEHERTKYTMTIRAYKPGSQLIEVKAWDKAKSMQWLPATTLAEQEKAIDDLLADPSASAPPMTVSGPLRATWWDLKDQKNLGLQPGTISAEQRRALQFASSEYSRLANGPAAASPQMQTTRERLVAKAVWLQRYADNKN